MSVDKIILLVVVLGGISYFFYNSAATSKKAEENAQRSIEFLEKNASKPGVMVTDSGLQYLVLQQGNNKVKPKADDTVKVHYHGTLLSGDVFDSSIDRGEPISFPLNRVIKGWTEGLQLMSPGDKYRFFIPASLAYGSRGSGKIEPESTLIFDVELIAINL